MARKKYNAQTAEGDLIYVKPNYKGIDIIKKSPKERKKEPWGKKIDLCPFSVLPQAA